MGAAFKPNDGRTALLFLMACQAGAQLFLPRRKSGTRAEVDQCRQALAAIRAGNMKTAWSVTGFAALSAVWRVGVAGIAMWTCRDYLHACTKMTKQAGFDAFPGEAGLAYGADSAIPTRSGSARAWQNGSQEQYAGQQRPDAGLPARQTE